MEKVLQPYDKERMRMAMLKHEEIFKQQVCELHRVYRIQKMLMGSVGLSQQHQQQQRQQQERFLVESKKAFTINGHHQNHHQQQQQQQLQLLQAQRIIDDGKSKGKILGLLQRPDDQVAMRSDAQEHIAESNSNVLQLDESEIELTLSLGPCLNSVENPRRRKTGKSESGQSLSSSSTGSSQTRKTSPKNSTSTITGGDQFTWASNNTFTTQGSEKEPGFSNGQQSNPPWLFQTLSLKLT